MKTVQGFLALRRSSASGLSISSQASPKEQEGSPSAGFSPLGSGLSTVRDAEASGAATQEEEGGIAPAPGAAGTPEPVHGDASAQSPAPATADEPRLGDEGSLAARLACEAAVQARKKASDHAAAASCEPSEASSAAPSIPEAAARGIPSEAPLQILEGTLVMTVGAAEPMARRKGARSPRGPVHAPPEAADEGTTACSAEAAPATGGLKHVLSAPADAPQAEAAPAPFLAPDEVSDDHAVLPEGLGSEAVCQGSCDKLKDAAAAEVQVAAPATPVPREFIAPPASCLS